MVQKRLSELVYEDLKGLTMRSSGVQLGYYITNENTFKEAVNNLMAGYGDVLIAIDLELPWYDQVQIMDERWQKDYKELLDKKQAWCDKYGCD